MHVGVSGIRGIAWWQFCLLHHPLVFMPLGADPCGLLFALLWASVHLRVVIVILGGVVGLRFFGATAGQAHLSPLLRDRLS